MITPTSSSSPNPPSSTDRAAYVHVSTDAKLKTYTDLILVVMRDFSEIQTTELVAAKEQIEITRKQIEKFRKDLAEKNRSLAAQAEEQRRAAEKNDIFGILADVFTMVAAAIACVICPTPLSFMLLALAAGQVAISRTNGIAEIAKSCGASEEEAAYTQLAVCIALTIVAISGGAAMAKGASAATQAAHAGTKIEKFKSVIQTIILASSGGAQTGKGITQIQLSNVQYDLDVLTVDQDKINHTLNFLDSLLKKASNELDEREKLITSIIENLMDLIAFFLKMVEKMAEEIEAKS